MNKEIIIDTINICPFHCKYCGTDSNVSKNYLATDKIKTILKLFNSEEVKIYLGGGYFFYHPDWKDILSYNKQVKANIVIDSPLVLETLNAIREFNLTEFNYKISLSLWGVNEVHDFLTNSKSYKNFSILHNELILQNEPLLLSFVLTKEMIKDIDNFIHFLDLIQSNTSIYFHRHMPCGRSESYDIPKIESIKTFEKVITDYAYNKNILTVKFHHTLVTDKCLAWVNRFFINHNGDIWGCGWINTNERSKTNIYDSDFSFHDLDSGKYITQCNCILKSTI